MIVKDIIEEIEKFAPIDYQESYDNSGLIVGDENWKTTGAIICFDVNVNVVKEAVNKGVNLIISHHPIIFKPLKSLNGKTPVEKVVIEAIKNNIAIYASHTNMDSAKGGVNWVLAKKLNLIDIEVLQPIANNLFKLIVYVPVSHSELVQQAVWNAGAGNIGEYENCSFKHSGIGSFKAKQGAKPFVGELNKLHKEEEERIEFLIERRNMDKAIQAMKLVHPYQEPAYDVYKQEIPLKNIGLGAAGNLEKETDLNVFFEDLKKELGVNTIRFNGNLNKKIKRIAVCGGSGSSLIAQAIATGADVMVTGDCTYHHFFDNAEKIVLADIGHYESEFFVKHIIYDILSKNLPKFAVYLSMEDYNPVSYF